MYQVACRTWKLRKAIHGNLYFFQLTEITNNNNNGMRKVKGLGAPSSGKSFYWKKYSSD